jgi:CheY-like chemotaxis protein
MTEILVVEDDKLLLNSMLQAIATISPTYCLFSAENGIQALDVLEMHTIRLLVTDLNMPEMDGFELLAQVIKNFPDIPVVVTTGHSIPDEQKAFFEQGALDILFKPFPMKKLLGAVTRRLEKQIDGGMLNNVSPEMFLQLIDMERKTCTVRVHQGEQGQMGVLFFRRGRLLDARMNELRGKAATLEIFSWDHITLSIENNCPVQELKINQTLNGLILEAARLKDERRGSIAFDEASLSDSSPQSAPSDTDDADQALSETLNERLELALRIDGVLERIDNDTRWETLLYQMRHIGQMLSAGTLNAVGMTTCNGGDYVVFPTRPSTVFKIDPNCPKEKLYQLVE